MHLRNHFLKYAKDVGGLGRCNRTLSTFHASLRCGKFTRISFAAPRQLPGRKVSPRRRLRLICTHSYDIPPSIYPSPSPHLSDPPAAMSSLSSLTCRKLIKCLGKAEEFRGMLVPPLPQDFHATPHRAPVESPDWRLFIKILLTCIQETEMH